MAKNYTNQKNNAEHQMLANEMIYIVDYLGGIDTAMVKDGVNGNVKTAYDKFREKLVDFKDRLNNHTMNSIELGKDEYSSKIETLQKDVNDLKKFKIVAIISTITLIVSVLKHLNVISFG